MRKQLNAIKPTKRQQKKAQADANNEQMCELMCNVLENKWGNPVKYNCANCLEEAYQAVLNDVQGYVTDEELIESSGGMLRNK